MRLKDVLYEIGWFVSVKIWDGGILDIPHKIRALKLKHKRGFSCCETYGLYWHLARYIYRGLKSFRADMEKYPSYPYEIGWEEWCATVDKMIDGFRLIEGTDSWFATEEEHKKMKLALELFAKHFQDLWL